MFEPNGKSNYMCKECQPENKYLWIMEMARKSMEMKKKMQISTGNEGYYNQNRKV